MSVLVKGMDMQESCYGCPLSRPIYHTSYCAEAGRNNTPLPEKKEWCPLVEVKTPHGRLIEAKAVKEKMKEWLDLNGYGTIGEYYFELIRCIDDTPTVIEAEEEEE